MKKPVYSTKAIVKEYNTIVNRIKLNEQLNQKLEETAQAIYKEWFVDFEFPMTKEYSESIGKPELEGKAYKSSGGEMYFNEELGKEIPAGWDRCEIIELFELQRGFDLTKTQVEEGKVPVYSSSGINYYHSQWMCEPPGIITGRKGKIGGVYFSNSHYWPHDTTLWVKKIKHATPFYVYFKLVSLDLLSMDVGSANPTLNRNDVHRLIDYKPAINLLRKFDDICSILFNYREDIKIQVNALTKLFVIILSKMTKA